MQRLTLLCAAARPPACSACPAGWFGSPPVGRATLQADIAANACTAGAVPCYSCTAPATCDWVPAHRCVQVARVTSVSDHPSGSEKLWLCKIDIGGGQERQASAGRACGLPSSQGRPWQLGMRSTAQPALTGGGASPRPPRAAPRGGGGGSERSPHPTPG